MNATLIQLTKYTLVGALGTIINASTLYFCTEYLRLWYMFSYALGVGVAWGSNFILHRHWTFKEAKAVAGT